MQNLTSRHSHVYEGPGLLVRQSGLNPTDRVVKMVSRSLERLNDSERELAIRGDYMPEFVKVAKKSDIASGEGMVVEVNGQPIALFNVGGEFYALDNVCPHRGGPIGEGYCDPHNLTVQCPWHGWVFSLKTGISPVNSAARVESFEVQVEGDEVMVALN